MPITNFYSYYTDEVKLALHKVYHLYGGFIEH
jgi:hypothetical protein